MVGENRSSDFSGQGCGFRERAEKTPFGMKKNLFCQIPLPPADLVVGRRLFFGMLGISHIGCFT